MLCKTEGDNIMDHIEYEKYRKLQKLRIETSDKFYYINLLIFRLNVLLDSTDSKVYDFDSLFGNIRLTVDDLYKYCHDFQERLEDY